MNWLRWIFGSSSTSEADRSVARSLRRITVNNPLVIESPRIGFFNLLDPSAQSIVDADKGALAPLFASLEQSDITPPLCDVLMIYANVESDGRIKGCSDGLRDIVRKSNAPIVIMASENEGRSYIAAGKRTGYGEANLVMVLKRKGPVFAQFFTQLFGKMSKGKSMPLAWVELAPQRPGATHENCPESIFSAEVSHIVFK